MPLQKLTETAFGICRFFVREKQQDLGGEDGVVFVVSQFGRHRRSERKHRARLALLVLAQIRKVVFQTVFNSFPRLAVPALFISLAMILGKHSHKLSDQRLD